MTDDGTPHTPEQERSERPAPGPLRTVAWGLLLVLLDLRVGWFDLLPDVVGWVLVAVGTGRLLADRPGDPGGRLVRLGAGLSAVLALADVVARVVVDGGRPDAVALVLGTGGIALGTAMFSLAAVVSVLTVLAYLGVVLGCATRGGDETAERRWWRLRFAYAWTAVPAVVLTFLMTLGFGEGGGGLAVSVVLAVGGVVTLVVAVLRSFRDARAPWAQPDTVATLAAPSGGLGPAVAV